MATSGGALSSVGRASRLHREGRRFEPVSAHHEPYFRSRVGASDPSSRERTFHADQTRWLVPLRRGSLFGTQSKSEERRGGKECASKCSPWWSPSPSKKRKTTTQKVWNLPHESVTVLTP